MPPPHQQEQRFLLRRRKKGNSETTRSTYAIRVGCEKSIFCRKDCLDIRQIFYWREYRANV